MAKRKRRIKPSGSPGYIPSSVRREIVKKAADEQLNRYVRDNQDKKNEAPGITSILQDMPKKKADFVKRNVREDGSLNSAALAILDPYLDERPEYSRGLNRLRTSSPQMMDAYARKFPIQNFAMQAGPMIAGAATGIPFGIIDLFNKGKKRNSHQRLQSHMRS